MRTCDRQETRKPAKPFLIGCVRVRILQEAPIKLGNLTQVFLMLKNEYRNENLRPARNTKARKAVSYRLRKGSNLTGGAN